ncbi:GNAT family N-acetyltransferase [Thiobaca trueperi]|uniref:Acetyltransferase (GNAT) family protein n=1 Tax=Thiobaca trueperi TaxID=127458 RepID=A0A4R3N128_9GAMM|nr:GNAT family N-acetyltransferase [Thiobaca trueperi]TCT22720.1 acetyltransferase (GNAT) family protein [Thiobaca trueperi]
MSAFISRHLPGDPRIRLKDGTPCRIRAIGPDDRDFLIACFAGLSPESRRMRFFTAKSSLTDGDLDFLTSADGRDHLALGAMRLDAWGQEVELLGVARCIRLGPDADASEFAISVVDAAQGRGLGKALFTHLVTAARRQGIRRFRCEVLAANAGMRALAAGLGGHVHWLDDGTLEYDYLFPPVTAPEATCPPALDHSLAAARLGADVWSSGTARVWSASLDLCRAWTDGWLDRWSAASASVASPRACSQ